MLHESQGKRKRGAEKKPDKMLEKCGDSFQWPRVEVLMAVSNFASLLFKLNAGPRH